MQLMTGQGVKTMTEVLPDAFDADDLAAGDGDGSAP
jgi:hypothetical protein